jgi:hypothetical protein
MAAQDDQREQEMRSLFNLERPEEYGRSDTDAILELDGSGVPQKHQGRQVPFELKSATGGEPDISTVRDLGLHHIEKWQDGRLHWLFGVYKDNRRQYFLYASPAQMQPWYDAMIAYAQADYEMAQCVPELITDATLSAVLGDAESFSYEEVTLLMKKQMKVAEYRAEADLNDEMYSRAAMLRLLRSRCRYLIERGSTRNNPHIPPSYFNEWEHIERNHAARLREMVIEALEREDAGVTTMGVSAEATADLAAEAQKGAE